MKLTPLSKIVIVVALSGLAYVAARSANLWPKPATEVVHPQPEPAPDAPPSAHAANPEPSPTRAVDTLRFAGSNTIGAELMPALAEAFLREQNASNLRRQPLARPVETKVTGEVGASARAFEIRAHGTSTAFTALRDGTADIAMASRRINAEGRQSLKSLGDMTAPSREHVLGVDGVSVIVRADRALNSLGMRDLARIFPGEVTDFAQVQAGAGSIHLYAQDDASGTFDTFKSLVLRSAPLGANAKRFEDGSALVAAVAQDARGIGFVSLSQGSSSSGVHAIALAEPGRDGALANAIDRGHRGLSAVTQVVPVRGETRRPTRACVRGVRAVEGRARGRGRVGFHRADTGEHDSYDANQPAAQLSEAHPGRVALEHELPLSDRLERAGQPCAARLGSCCRADDRSRSRRR